MREFTEQFVEAYLDAIGSAATASVGGYQLEKAGIQLFERIEGDHFVILGLPLMALLQFLRREGAIAASDPTGSLLDLFESMFVIGLTGSLGMGKSTTARLFAEQGVPVHDADAVVHRLYEGEAVPAIEAAFPGTTSSGKVDRERLAALVLRDPAALKRLEAIVHPLVHAAERRLLAEAQARGEKIAVLDIPLLFETGSDARVDAVVVASAPPEVQQSRVLERPGMTMEKLEAILANRCRTPRSAAAPILSWTPRAESRTRAQQVRAILDAVATMPKRRR